jgi:hypothetical protein
MMAEDSSGVKQDARGFYRIDSGCQPADRKRSMSLTEADQGRGSPLMFGMGAMDALLGQEPRHGAQRS